MDAQRSIFLTKKQYNALLLLLDEHKKKDETLQAIFRKLMETAW